MISVDEALDHVRRAAAPLPAERTPLAHLLHLRLAEPVASRVDSPPFDKSMVDGYAIDVSDSSPTLRELELVTAGSVPNETVIPGATVRVMTGAPIPAGADAVVKWEDCQLLSDLEIRNPAAGVKSGSCIIRRGTSFRAGQLVLAAGKRLGPLDVALLAEIGQAEVAVIPRPRVAVLPTGDELVAAHEPLGPGQIRNSNGPMLLAAVAAADCTPIDLGVGCDDPDDLRTRINQGLAHDVLLVSGGVSAGVKDLVPGILQELGVEQQFHQVRIKPGKPLYFGVRHAAGRRTLVFGLPGNPVSTFVSFQLFVLPALRALAGAPFKPIAAHDAQLTMPFEHRGKRPTYHPCRQTAPDAAGVLQVEPLDWRGSSDLATLTRATHLAAFPAGDYQLVPGDDVQVIPL
ncbi:molybdopterin molybdotransferase MoeA [Lacipirellula limnantheis]|uniref:Molybdopterin molybdenumtransferase n=1 Tax=Lacipirellula limnantheis TaxID=2528024 RepID=A0A517TRX8_9BACT|nr:gephyrin-like molybdotransferase Glp [Lacipirellula limnantheis]QDT71127.1 Molybdopterin molybdenumtransferase [Lacipirellula limnantheis]